MSMSKYPNMKLMEGVIGSWDGHATCLLCTHRAQEEHAAVHKEREALRGRTDALQMTLMQSQGQEGGLGRDYTPDAILKKVGSLCGRLVGLGVLKLDVTKQNRPACRAAIMHTRPPPAKLVAASCCTVLHPLAAVWP